MQKIQSIILNKVRKYSLIAFTLCFDNDDEKSFCICSCELEVPGTIFPIPFIDAVSLLENEFAKEGGYKRVKVYDIKLENIKEDL